MNNNKLGKGTLCAALLSLPAALLAAPPQHYVGVHAGVNNLNDWPASVDFGGGVGSSGSLTLDSGAHLGLLLGRQTDNARFEIEYQHGRFDVEQAQLAGIAAPASGNGKYDVLTLNAYRTIAIADRWTAYAGGGIGWGRARLPAASVGGCNCFPAASRSGLAWQLRAGAEYDLGAGHGVFAQASWLSLPKSSSGGTPSVTYSRNGVASINVGWRKRF